MLWPDPLVEPGVASATLIAPNLQTGERSPIREFLAPDSAGTTRFDLYIARDGEAYAYSLDRWLTTLFILENVD